MALSNGLAKAGTPPETLETTADVTFQPGEGITGIHLTVRGTVPGMTADDFVAAAEAAKTGCPVSQALTGTTITLTATLAWRTARLASLCRRARSASSGDTGCGAPACEAGQVSSGRRGEDGVEHGVGAIERGAVDALVGGVGEGGVAGAEVARGHAERREAGHVGPAELGGDREVVPVDERRAGSGCRGRARPPARCRRR